jgi:hypothetical protein
MLHALQTTEAVPGLLLDWDSLLHMHMSALYSGEQLQSGSLTWAGCYLLWPRGMSEPGRVFGPYAYAAMQQLTQVPTRCLHPMGDTGVVDVALCS